MTGYFEEEAEAKLYNAKEALNTANLKLEEIEADLQNKPNFVAKKVLELRKYKYRDMKLEAEGIIQELEG